MKAAQVQRILRHADCTHASQCRLCPLQDGLRSRLRFLLFRAHGKFRLLWEIRPTVVLQQRRNGQKKNHKRLQLQGRHCSQQHWKRASRSKKLACFDHHQCPCPGGHPFREKNAGQGLKERLKKSTRWSPLAILVHLRLQVVLLGGPMRRLVLPVKGRTISGVMKPTTVQIVHPVSQLQPLHKSRKFLAHHFRLLYQQFLPFRFDSFKVILLQLL